MSSLLLFDADAQNIIEALQQARDGAHQLSEASREFKEVSQAALKSILENERLAEEAEKEAVAIRETYKEEYIEAVRKRTKIFGDLEEFVGRLEKEALDAKERIIAEAKEAAERIKRDAIEEVKAVVEAATSAAIRNAADKKVCWFV